MTGVEPRRLLRTLFDVAVAAATPSATLARHLPPPPSGRTILVGAGKAAAVMAQAFEAAWPHRLEGVVVTPYGHAVPCRRVRVLEAAHPVPDEAGLRASATLFDAVSGLTPDDLVVALISGGGSALLPCPPPGLTLADEQALNRLLLASGLPIGEMNLLRKHVSGIKGGRLARAASPARLLTLVLSDVPGDQPAQVASGPTLPDGTTRNDALALLEQTRLVLPEAILSHLRSDAAHAPDPHDPCFRGHEVRVVGSAVLSLEAAARACAERFGMPAVILSDGIEGEAREVARMHGALARQVSGRGQPFTPPVVLLSGGETTVRIENAAGCGGRNTEFALSLAIDLHGSGPVHALAADTDGIDGASGGAGAFVDATTVARLRQRGLNPQRLLRDHETAAAFEALGDLLVTGPTHTNVNDFRAILVLPQP